MSFCSFQIKINGIIIPGLKYGISLGILLCWFTPTQFCLDNLVAFSYFALHWSQLQERLKLTSPFNVSRTSKLTSPFNVSSGVAVRPGEPGRGLPGRMEAWGEVDEARPQGKQRVLRGHLGRPAMQELWCFCIMVRPLPVHQRWIDVEFLHGCAELVF